MAGAADALLLRCCGDGGGREPPAPGTPTDARAQPRRPAPHQGGHAPVSTPLLACTQLSGPFVHSRLLRWCLILLKTLIVESDQIPAKIVLE
jgi:hypothetical protein